MKNLHSHFSSIGGEVSALNLTLRGMNLRTLQDIHSVLLQRFEGWLENFTGEPPGDALASMLPAPPGELLQLSDPEQVLSTAQLLAVAQAWERADCFIWAARSSRLHRDWDPLVESFAAFEASDPTCASYTLGLDPIEPKSGVQQILGFIVMQGLEQATSTSYPQAAAAAP
jgi:hypothetical protein